MSKAEAHSNGSQARQTSKSTSLPLAARIGDGLRELRVSTPGPNLGREGCQRPVHPAATTLVTSIVQSARSTDVRWSSIAGGCGGSTPEVAVLVAFGRHGFKELAHFEALVLLTGHPLPVVSLPRLPLLHTLKQSGVREVASPTPTSPRTARLILKWSIVSTDRHCHGMAGAKAYQPKSPRLLDDCLHQHQLHECDDALGAFPLHV